MVIYNLFTSVVALTAFVLSSAVQGWVIYFSGPVALQIARSGSIKDHIKMCLVQFNVHLITNRATCVDPPAPTPLFNVYIWTLYWVIIIIVLLKHTTHLSL